jgi:hypothetical protein
MTINIELRLLATMAARGDFGPIERGDIKPSDFVSDQGKIVYNSCVNYSDTTGGASRWPSLAILKSRFKAAGFDFPTPDPGDTVEGLAHETLAQAARRDINMVANDLIRIAAMPDFAGELPERAALLTSIVDRQQRATRMSFSEGLRDLLVDLADGPLVTGGIPWPWPLLQNATQGQHAGQLLWTVGRPKNKKTFVALKVAANNAITHGASGVIFTPEMPAKTFILRVAALAAGVRYAELKNDGISEDERQRLLELAEDVCAFEDPQEGVARVKFRNGATLDIMESAGRSLSWIRSQLVILRPKWTLLDSAYLQTPSSGQKFTKENERVSAVSRELKAINMELKLVVHCTHQLNRAASKEVAGLEDVAFSDSVGQDADLVLSATSGILEGGPKTALRVLGAREIEFDGLLIHSKVCEDFSEIGLIPNMSVVKKLMGLAGKEEDKNKAKAMLNRAALKKT